MIIVKVNFRLLGVGIQYQGRSQEFATEKDKRVGLGRKSLAGPGAEARWGLEAKPPEAGDKC